jgi:peroxiredoxin
MQLKQSFCLGVSGLIATLALSFAGCSQRQPSASKDDAAAASATADSTSGTELVAPADEPASSTATDPAATERPAIEVAQSETADAPALEVPTEPAVEKTQASRTPAPLPASAAPLPLDSVAAADLKMPGVVLSDQHATLCKVKVGDQFPALELPTLTGDKKSLNELFGPKLTLVVFWNGQQPTGLEELADLSRYHLPRFADKGLAVVAINTGDDATKAGELSQKAGTAYPVLSDADGAALAQVAAGKLPRSYLLDPSGKVLWFDLEYSPTTRRDLASAIRFTLERP